MFNVDAEEHAMTFPGFGINSDCHCTEASPEPDCDFYYWTVHYSTLCRNLHLTPGEPIFNQKNQEVDVLYAWYPESIGGGGEDRYDYPREQEEFDSDPDKLAWYEYAGATVRFPWHQTLFEIGLHQGESIVPDDNAVSDGAGAAGLARGNGSQGSTACTVSRLVSPQQAVNSNGCGASLIMHCYCEAYVDTVHCKQTYLWPELDGSCEYRQNILIALRTQDVHKLNPGYILTAEEQNLMANRDKAKPFLSDSGVQSKDLASLEPGQQLTDGIVKACSDLIMANPGETSSGDTDRILIADPYFASRVLDGNAKAAMKFLAAKTLLPATKVLFPVVVGHHWFLMVYAHAFPACMWSETHIRVHDSSMETLGRSINGIVTRIHHFLLHAIFPMVASRHFTRTKRERTYASVLKDLFDRACTVDRGGFDTAAWTVGFSVDHTSMNTDLSVRHEEDCQLVILPRSFADSIQTTICSEWSVEQGKPFPFNVVPHVFGKSEAADILMETICGGRLNDQKHRLLLIPFAVAGSENLFLWVDINNSDVDHPGWIFGIDGTGNESLALGEEQQQQVHFFRAGVACLVRAMVANNPAQSPLQAQNGALTKPTQIADFLCTRLTLTSPEIRSQPHYYTAADLTHQLELASHAKYMPRLTPTDLRSTLVFHMTYSLPNSASLGTENLPEYLDLAGRAGNYGGELEIMELSRKLVSPVLILRVPAESGPLKLNALFGPASSGLPVILLYFNAGSKHGGHYCLGIPSLAGYEKERDAALRLVHVDPVSLLVQYDGLEFKVDAFGMEGDGDCFFWASDLAAKSRDPAWQAGGEKYAKARTIWCQAPDKDSPSFRRMETVRALMRGRTVAALRMLAGPDGRRHGGSAFDDSLPSTALKRNSIRERYGVGLGQPHSVLMDIGAGALGVLIPQSHLQPKLLCLGFEKDPHLYRTGRSIQLACIEGGLEGQVVTRCQEATGSMDYNGVTNIDMYMGGERKLENPDLDHVLLISKLMSTPSVVEISTTKLASTKGVEAYADLDKTFAKHLPEFDYFLLHNIKYRGNTFNTLMLIRKPEFRQKRGPLVLSETPAGPVQNMILGSALHRKTDRDGAFCPYVTFTSDLQQLTEATAADDDGRPLQLILGPVDVICTLSQHRIQPGQCLLHEPTGSVGIYIGLTLQGQARNPCRPDLLLLHMEALDGAGSPVFWLVQPTDVAWCDNGVSLVELSVPWYQETLREATVSVKRDDLEPDAASGSLLGEHPKPASKRSSKRLRAQTSQETQLTASSTLSTPPPLKAAKLSEDPFPVGQEELALDSWERDNQQRRSSLRNKKRKVTQELEELDRDCALAEDKLAQERQKLQDKNAKAQELANQNQEIQTQINNTRKKLRRSEEKKLKAGPSLQNSEKNDVAAQKNLASALNEVSLVNVKEFSQTMKSLPLSALPKLAQSLKDMVNTLPKLQKLQTATDKRQKNLQHAADVALSRAASASESASTGLAKLEETTSTLSVRLSTIAGIAESIGVESAGLANSKEAISNAIAAAGDAGREQASAASKSFADFLRKQQEEQQVLTEERNEKQKLHLQNMEAESAGHHREQMKRATMNNQDAIETYKLQSDLLQQHSLSVQARQRAHHVANEQALAHSTAMTIAVTQLQAHSNEVGRVANNMTQKLTAQAAAVTDMKVEEVNKNVEHRLQQAKLDRDIENGKMMIELQTFRGDFMQNMMKHPAPAYYGGAQHQPYAQGPQGGLVGQGHGMPYNGMPAQGQPLGPHYAPGEFQHAHGGQAQMAMGGAAAGLPHGPAPEQAGRAYYGGAQHQPYAQGPQGGLAGQVQGGMPYNGMPGQGQPLGPHYAPGGLQHAHGGQAQMAMGGAAAGNGQPAAVAPGPLNIGDFGNWGAQEVELWMVQIGCRQLSSLFFPAAGAARPALIIVSGRQLTLITAAVLDQIVPHDDAEVSLSFEKLTFLQALATLVA